MYNTVQNHTQQRKIEINDDENVIAFFEINTRPKVTIFDGESTSIQFYGQ